MRNIQSLSTSWMLYLLIIIFTSTQIVPLGFANEFLADSTINEVPEIPVDDVSSDASNDDLKGDHEAFFDDTSITQAEVPTPIKRHSDVAYGEDEKQTMDIVHKEGLEEAPIVVIIHGGGWEAGDKSSFEHIANDFASNSAVVANINYRLTENGFMLDDLMQDVASAVAKIQQDAHLYGGDGSNIIIYGHSAGAHLGATLTYSDKDWLVGTANEGTQLNIKGFIGSSGAYDFDLIPKGRHSALGKLIGDEKTAAGDWNHAEPINFVDENDPPALLITGDADGFINWENTIALSDALTSVNVASDLLVLEGYGHNDPKSFFLRGNEIKSHIADFMESLTVDTVPAHHPSIDALVELLTIEGMTKEEIEKIRGDARIVSMEATQWSNGCRGWSLPNQMCTMAFVRGYTIMIELYGNTYEFHDMALDPAKRAAIHVVKSKMRDGIALETIKIVSSVPSRINTPTDDLRAWYAVTIASGEESWKAIVDLYSGDFYDEPRIDFEMVRKTMIEIREHLAELTKLQSIYQEQSAVTNKLEYEKLWAERTLAGGYVEYYYTTMVWRMPEDYAAQQTIFQLEEWYDGLHLAFKNEDLESAEEIINAYNELIEGAESGPERLTPVEGNLDAAQVSLSAAVDAPFYYIVLSPKDAKALYEELIKASQAKAAILPGEIAALKEQIEARRVEWEEVARRTLESYGSLFQKYGKSIDEGGAWGWNEFIRGELWPPVPQKTTFTDADGNILEGEVIPVRAWLDNKFTWVESRPFIAVLADGTEIKIEFRNGEMDPVVKEKLDEMMSQNPIVESMPFGRAKIDIEWSINASGDKVLLASIKSQNADGVSEILASFEVSDYEMKPVVIRNQTRIHQLALRTPYGQKIIFNSKISENRVLQANYTVYEQVKSKSLQSILNKMTRFNLSGNKVLKAWERIRHVHSSLNARYIGRQIIQSTRWVRNDVGHVTAVNIVRRAGDGSTVRVRKTIDEQGEAKYFVKAYKAQPERGIVFKGHLEDTRLMRENSGLLLNLSGIAENGQVIAIMILPETIRLLSAMDIDGNALDEDNLNLKEANLPIDEPNLFTPDRYDIRPADLEEFERKLETSRILDRTGEPTRVFSNMLVSDEGRSLIKYYENLQEKYKIS